jgi:primosomal protein N' (replication factor Y)
VVIQTYWPDHPAILAAAAHDPSLFYAEEEAIRTELGYPPFGRLANLLVWGHSRSEVARVAGDVAVAIQARLPEGWNILGPSPSPLSRVKNVWRWHVLVKAPLKADLASPLRAAMKSLPRQEGVAVVADVDPVDLL